MSIDGHNYNFDPNKVIGSGGLDKSGLILQTGSKSKKETFKKILITEQDFVEQIDANSSQRNQRATKIKGAKDLSFTNPSGLGPVAQTIRANIQNQVERINEDRKSRNRNPDQWVSRSKASKLDASDVEDAQIISGARSEQVTREEFNQLANLVREQQKTIEMLANKDVFASNARGAAASRINHGLEVSSFDPGFDIDNDPRNGRGFLA